jgi:predicted RNA binding protein YcfA (HicA-like mRNA interferase family)
VKQISGKDFSKLLEARGWVLSRISGSHHVYAKSGQRERIVVPIHGNKPLKLGLLKAQMKIAEIKEDQL